MQSPDRNETHDSSTTSHVLAARDTNVEYHQGIQEHLRLLPEGTVRVSSRPYGVVEFSRPNGVVQINSRFADP